MKKSQCRPITVGKILVSEFLKPMNIEISELAEAMGVHRNTLSRIIHDKGRLTAPVAIKLATALDNPPEFWLRIQHAVDVWDVRNRVFDKESKNVRCIKSKTERVDARFG